MMLGIKWEKQSLMGLIIARSLMSLWLIFSMFANVSSLTMEARTSLLPLHFGNVREVLQFVPTRYFVIPASASQSDELNQDNAFSNDKDIITTGWDIRVLEVIRGDTAWQIIQFPYQLNPHADRGMEYLLVKIYVKCTRRNIYGRLSSIDNFMVVGDRSVQHPSVYVTQPNPKIRIPIRVGTEAEGWLAFIVEQHEGNLLLAFDESLGYDEVRHHLIALDRDAFISASSGVLENQITSLGVQRVTPAPIKTIVVAEDWRITLLEAERGEGAWQIVKAANQFNTPPDKGMEYIAAKMRVRYIGTEDVPVQINNLYFKAIGDANVLYDLPFVVAPKPVLDAFLFPGQSVEGWMIFKVRQGETNVTAVFEPLFSSSDVNRRFLSLEP